VLHFADKLSKNKEFLQNVRCISTKSVASSEKEIENLGHKDNKIQKFRSRFKTFLFGVVHDRSDMFDNIREQYQLLAICKVGQMSFH
jgi:hypothetical protein